MHTVYKLDQTTINGGKLTDFSLPRTIGYYASTDGAKRAKLAHIARNASGDDWTTDEDYETRPITVQD